MEKISRDEQMHPEKYAASQDEDDEGVRCPSCGSLNDAGDSSCSSCGLGR